MAQIYFIVPDEQQHVLQRLFVALGVFVANRGFQHSAKLYYIVKRSVHTPLFSPTTQGVAFRFCAYTAVGLSPCENHECGVSS